MKNYIRNPRKKEMTNAGSPVQDSEGNSKKEVSVHKEGDSSSKESSTGDGGKD